MKRYISALLAAAVAFSVSTSAMAQEHPASHVAQPHVQAVQRALMVRNDVRRSEPQVNHNVNINRNVNVDRNVEVNRNVYNNGNFYGNRDNNWQRYSQPWNRTYRGTWNHVGYGGRYHRVWYNGHYGFWFIVGGINEFIIDDGVGCYYYYNGYNTPWCDPYDDVCSCP